MGGAQVIFLSVGAGPIVNRISKILLLGALRKADYRSYRDVAAFNYLKSIGYDTSKDLLYPDLVFSLPKTLLPASKISFSKPRVVGLGLINYFGHQYEPLTGEKIYQEYISKIKRFVFWLFQEGYAIRILRGDRSDKWPTQDIIDFVDKEGESGWRDKLIAQEITNANDLFREIAQTDIVVASRFHNILSSIMLERPVISLSYHEKNDFLLKDMGLGQYCQHIEDFTNDKLIVQFNLCIHETDQIVSQIHDKLNHYDSSLDEQYERLLS
jgi:polysaccharide pyruvyl transferase WcaK-like protein